MRFSSHKLIWVTIVIVFSLTTTAHAMRCGNEIVGDGSTKREVLHACGEPLQKFGDDLVLGDTNIARSGDEKWVYDIGGGVYHIIYFDGFHVRKIEIEQK